MTEPTLDYERFMADMNGEYNAPTVREMCVVVSTDTAEVIVYVSDDADACDAVKMTLRSVDRYGHNGTNRWKDLYYALPTKHFDLDVMSLAKAQGIGAISLEQYLQ